MTSVEKRRSGRKSGGHRKHSDGGYSDTSSGGSFLDETDREVSNLTDRAFRSLCIGDEAVYNDSDLCSSSPCVQRDRQLAFSQSGLDAGREDREREELKRAAHESFSLRMQQYGQDWIHGGMYGAEIQRDPQWEAYGERTQGRVSATFQHSFVETSQQEESLRREQLSFLSNGATELGSQQRRSRSRVSSLIKAFNSEGYRDGAGMDGKHSNWNDETSWDKSALMSIQRELSEFSTSYQQNFNSGHFPPAGPFSPRDTNFYSSEVAAMTHMNSESSFMRSSHSKHSMSAQFNSNSNFFIHSEFSPFKVWRDHNRFPFQQGEVSGFMHCSEFPKWYETPMYKELSLEAQPQAPYRFEEKGIRHPRNNLAPVVPPAASRSTSTSTMLQKAMALEKRCESELAGHYPHRKRTQSLGANRLPSQRPSTASPSSEMSRRVQDTISSVKALQQKIKMMAEQNTATGMMSNELAPNVVSSNTSTTPFNISQLLTPSVNAYQDIQSPEVRQSAASPQPVEHPPVRAESRGATPDVRMSSYKSRATSLLFNLKDNRKRVKSTYSPTKFKGLETVEKNKQLSIQEPRDTVIDIPDYPDPDSQYTQVEESGWTNAAPYQFGNQYHNPGLALPTLNSQPATAPQGQYSEYSSFDYRTAQMQGEMVHHSGFTGFIPENYASNQLANGQNLNEDLSSFTPYKQGMTDSTESMGGDAYRLKPHSVPLEMPRLNADSNQMRDYLPTKANTEYFNETVGRDFTKADKYQQLKENKHDYSNVSSRDRWRQTNYQDTENLCLKTAVSPWKQEITASMENDQHAQGYQRAAGIKEEPHLPQRDKYRGESQQNKNKELDKTELRDNFSLTTSSHKNTGLVNPNVSNQLTSQYPLNSNTAVENPAHQGQHQPETVKDKYVLEKYHGHNEENEMKDIQNYNRYTDQDYRNQHTFYQNKERTMVTQETNPIKQIPKDNEMQNLKPKEIKPQLEHNMQENSLSNPDNASAHTMANRAEHRPFVEVKAEQAVAEHLKAQHAQAELAKAQHWAQVEQPKVESAGLILAERTGSEQVKEEQAIAAVPGHEISNQAKTEHITDERRKIEQTEQSREEQSERAIEEHTKAQRNRVQAAKPKNITAEAEAQQMRGERGEQVEAEDAEAGRLKGEHIKSELAKTEQAGQESLKQAKTEPARGEKIKAEQHQEEEERAEQVERERREVEQIRTEEVKAEQAEKERGKAEQATLEQRKEHQVRAEQEKIEVAEDISVQWGQVKAELPPTQLSKVLEEQAVDKKVEQTKLEQSNKEQAKTELTKTDIVQERSAKPAAKLTVTQEIKSEPDKVEQVKTELAKAKAELAKIKEKMRGEQKEKVRNVIPSKGDAAKKDDPVRVNTNEKRDQGQATQMHQQKENSGITSKQNTDQAYRGGDEYKRLREKYGFTETTPSSRNELSIAGNASSNDTNAKPILSLDRAETTNNEKLKDKHSPTSVTATANAESKEESASSEVTESLYVYSESSKEFKLSSADNVPTNVNSGMVTDKVKDDNISKLEMSDPLKQTNVSQQRDSDLGKLPSLERKSKSTEHSVGPNKDFTPPRALSNKERAQTKQEILTSKIKAHAEKEISAIKEKGFALRDGIISKNSIKQLTGSQSINIRQKPPSQELPKKNESTMSSNITPKPQTVPPGAQVETFTAVSPSSSATMPVKSAATNSQKNVPKEITKSNVSNPKDAKQTGSYTMSTEKGLLENQKKEHQSGLKSPMQEQTPKNKPGKQEANHGEISAKQKEGLKDDCALNTDNVNKKKEDPQATALVKAESSILKREKAETKHEAVLEDSAPSINILHGHNETPAADDSLQITGIMVTVRERQPSVNNSQGNNNTQEQIPSKAKDSSNLALDKHNFNPERDLTKGSKSLKEVSRVKADDSNSPNTHPSVKEDQTKDGTNNHPENMQQTSVETRQNNMSESVTVKRINLQASSSTNAKPQRDTRLQEPVDENVVPSTVTAPAKNKALAETQPLPHTQDTAARETKDYTNKTPKENSAESTRKEGIKRNSEDKNPQKRQTAHSNDNLAKMVNTGTNNTNDSKRAFAETVIKHDTQSSVEEDMTTVKSPSKSRTLDGENATPLEEKRHNLTQSKPLNKNSPSNHLTENENIHVSSKHQQKETLIGENNHEDNEVHIGSIAIRVVPPVTDNLKVLGKHHGTTVPSVVADIDHKLVLSSSHEEKMDTSNQENKGNTPVSSEKHNVLSGVRTHSENTKVDDGKSENFDRSGKSENESKIQPMEGGYFQVQGVAEANNEPHKSANVGDTADAASKQRERPGLQPKIAATGNKSYHEGKNEVFALNQSKTKIAQSSSASIQDESIKRKTKETEDNLALKQSDDPTERWTNKSERKEASLSANIRKQHTENQSSLSGRERQNRGNSDPPKENTVKEKPEVKPKPKERVSTIPEISALADYARLKVIVSEDKANTIQDFTPNKKEGFFPLIQSRQSRRPVFTADPQDLSTKEKSLPIKTEVSSKVNKEPKPLAFPITDREHQRTGMFKLGDKERQEKTLSDAKANENDTGATHAQHLKERNKLPTPHLKNQGNGEKVVGTDTSTVHQVNLSNNPTLKTSSAVNKQSNPSVSQPKTFDNFNPQEKPDEFSSKTKRIPDLDKNSPPKPTVGQEQNIGERTLRKDEKTGMTLHEETKDKQSKAKLLDKEITHEKKEERRAEHMKIKNIIEESRASLAEEERKTAQREEERRAREREAITNRIKERREKQREEEKRAEEERKAKQAEDERVVLKEEEMRLQKKEKMKMKETEENRRIKIEEDRRAKVREEEKQIKESEEKRVKQQEEERAAREEQQRRAVQEEQRRRAAQEERQRRAAQEEQQRRAAQEEQQRRAAQEEQQRRAALIKEQQRRAAEEEQQRRAAQEEQQRRAAQEEQQRRAAQEEQQRRAAEEERQRRAALVEEQKRRAVEEEQQRRAALVEEQKRRAVEEEQQRRAALVEEQQRRTAKEEQQRRAALVEEQRRRAAQEEQQRRAAKEEQQRRAALVEEHQRRAAEEEQQQRAALVEEQQRRAAQEEQQRRAAKEEQQRRAALVEEQQRRAAQEEQQRRAALSEEKRRTEQIEEKKIAQVSGEEMIKQTQQQRKAEQHIKEQRDERHKREEWMREEGRRAVQTEKSNIRESGGNEAKEERTRIPEKSQAVLNEEENRYTQERVLAQREDEIRAKNRRGGEKLAADRENYKATQMEEQKRMTQQVDSLQYYAITSTESEIKPSERQVRSPLPSQRRSNPSGQESAEDYHNRSFRPHAPASPAPSMPRSNTSSPALGFKPSMFRVKDNTFKGSSFTKSVKPRFHKNFGEDFRVGSPMGSERGEEEAEILRRSAVTPVHPDTGLSRLSAIKESSAFSSQDHPYPHHRPYSRRSIALDEDDSRSVISNVSEDVESFATSAADLADIRGLYDYDRPESACSFSSDVSRSLGKPPAVPPKSEKALRRAKRLTTRRIKKELSKAVSDSPAGVEKPLQEPSSNPSSSSTEVWSSNRHAVASPHFSPPVSLANAPPLGSRLPASHTEHQSSHSSFYASPHATGPISLPAASPHATAPVSIPVASPHATGLAAHPAAPKIVADVPSSPTLHHANHPAPVTQYHVESSYPSSYPLTQRKVLQDLGSGQYFVVDVPVQVKTKTFFDPETGKYVQLNVRESAKSASRSNPQQTYLQPQVHAKPNQQQALSQDSPAGKHHMLYQGYHGYPQGYQPAGISSVSHSRSSSGQQPVREDHSYGYPAPEMGQNSEGHRYSPEKTPYMDTVNDTDKPHNTVYNTHGSYESFPECDTNSQLAGSSVCENDNSAHSQYQPRDIIAMSELEDFMELSDW